MFWLPMLDPSAPTTRVSSLEYGEDPSASEASTWLSSSCFATAQTATDVVETVTAIATAVSSISRARKLMGTLETVCGRRPQTVSVLRRQTASRLLPEGVADAAN